MLTKNVKIRQNDSLFFTIELLNEKHSYSNLIGNYYKILSMFFKIVKILLK